MKCRPVIQLQVRLHLLDNNCEEDQKINACHCVFPLHCLVVQVVLDVELQLKTSLRFKE